MKKQKLFSLIASVHLARIDALPSQLCSNNALFQVEDGTRTLKCTQIESEERDRIRLCQNEDVRDNCPQSCGLCCDDNPVFTFKTNNGSTRNCEWLGKEVRQFLYCDNKDKNGTRISDSCPKACNKCMPFVKDNIPQYLLELTQSPTSQITSSPTSSPPPTVSECQDDLSFRFKGKPFESCKQIRRNESIRQELCGNEEVVRSACPFTCGLCCADDDDYTFLSRNKRRELTCSILEDSKLKQLKNCNRLQNDKLVKAACPKSCNTCMKSVARVNTQTDDRIDGTVAGASQQEPSSEKSKLPVFLGLSISFILLGIILLAMFFIRKKRQSKWEEVNNSVMNVGDTDIIIGKVLPHNTSFVGPNISNLGNKKTSQTDVQKCPEFRPHFDCDICEHQDKEVEFVKVSKDP